MILIIIAALGLGASIVILRSSESEIGYGIGMVCSLSFGIVLTVMIIAATCANSFNDRSLAVLQAEREALAYQAENNIYLGDAVGKFNSELIRNQLGRENPWTSWFYGSYWLEVEPIELNKQAEIAPK